LITLYRPEVGNERLDCIKNLVASFPYLLKHHIRSGCLCQTHEDVDDQFKMVLQEPSTQIVDSRYEGDKVSGGAYRPNMDLKEQQSRQCIVDRHNLPWRLLDTQQQSEDSSTLLQVAQATNRPLWVCDRLGQEIMGIPYSQTFSSRERLAIFPTIKVEDAKKEAEDFVMFEQTPKPELNKLILEIAPKLLRKKNGTTVTIQSWERPKP
jgi:hypothetical protein